MTKKHVEEKMDDLKKRLQGNEEKLAVYERRTGNGSSLAVPQNMDESLSKEQQLEAEVAELRFVFSAFSSGFMFCANPNAIGRQVCFEGD